MALGLQEFTTKWRDESYISRMGSICLNIHLIDSDNKYKTGIYNIIILNWKSFKIF